MAPWLSHHIRGITADLSFNYASKAWIHNTYEVADANALYSDSVLEWETACYFLDDQETKFEPRNTAYPATDFLSSLSQAQSASVK